MASSPVIRIAHVIQNLNYGGMERVLHSLAMGLPSFGFEVHIVVLQYLGHFADGLKDRVTFHQVPPMSKLSLLYPGPLAEVLRRVGPDVVHSHTGVWLKSSRASRMAGVRAVVHTEHGRPDPVPLTDRLIDNCASRSTDAVIAVSEALAGVLRRWVVHQPDQVRVIPNGVDVDALRPPSDRTVLRKNLGLAPDALVIGSIGRLEPVKNYQLALRALARLRREMGALAPVLVLAGDGSERASLEQLARQLDISAQVRFLGWRNDADQLYGAFDIFTLTSKSEGTSISLLESMSTGVCPVVTDVGGNRAVLGPPLAHLLVPGDDEIALAERWRRQLTDRDSRAAAGVAARQRVVADFSLHRMLEDHVALYRALLARDSHPPRAGR